jgi:biotin carboxyl carrier protein
VDEQSERIHCVHPKAMKREVQIGERMHLVELGSGVTGSGQVNGEVLAADFAEIRPGLYSVLWKGRSYEVHVEPAATRDGLHVYVSGGSSGELGLGPFEFFVRVHDPRRLRRRGVGGFETAGRQQVAAPMPGRVVRVLVQEGDVVEAGQGLLVVEAMKMQNEIHSPKRGKIEKVSAAVGQAVNAGETLVIVA